MKNTLILLACCVGLVAQSVNFPMTGTFDPKTGQFTAAGIVPGVVAPPVVPPVVPQSALAVLGSSPTQAIIGGIGPGSCKIEVSESPTYVPPVHDVDPALFFGADAVSGPFFVVGKRFSTKAADGNNYSRALQAGTRHYARLTCGTAVQTLDFATAPLAVGTSYNDGPQIDTVTPGQWLEPTRFDDRTQTIVDPQTGALLHAVSINDEGGLPSGFNGIFMLYGGFARMCAPGLVGPAGGPLGFACTMVRYGQGGGVAYWIVPSTGEVRLLGSVPITGGGASGPLVNGPDGSLRTYGPDNSGNTIWQNYTGNFVPSKELPVDGWHTYSTVSIGDLVHGFDNGFDPHAFNCGKPWAAAGTWALVNCGTGQDAPGWLAVLYGGDGRAIDPACADGEACPRIVAAVDVFHQAATLNCTLHNVQPMDDVISINVQTLDGQPRCAAMGHMVYWRFKTDPHGASLVIDNFFDGGGHWDHGPMGRVSETGGGWGVVVGAPPADFLNRPYTREISDSPFFAGARGLSWGSTTSKHPSYHQVAGDTSFLLDMLPFDGGQFYSPAAGATPISGQLFRYNPSIEQPSAALARKRLPTLAVSGGRALVDISGPGSVLTDTVADSFKYCVALVAGECRADAAAGDIFVNAPAVWKTFCAGADGPVPDLFDLCIGNMGAFHQALVQADVTGAIPPRVITYGLAGIRNSFFYSTAKALPDASWALFSWGVVKNGFGNVTNVWMAKLPSLVNDGIDRTSFARSDVTLVNPGNGATAAVVEFGYAEFGDPAAHWCTSRHEACVAGAGSAPDTDPFRYATESMAAVPCSATCSVTIPVVPGHVAYWRPVWLDDRGARVSTGPESALVR